MIRNDYRREKSKRIITHRRTIITVVIIIVINIITSIIINSIIIIISITFTLARMGAPLDTVFTPPALFSLYSRNGQ